MGLPLCRSAFFVELCRVQPIGGVGPSGCERAEVSADGSRRVRDRVPPNWRRLVAAPRTRQSRCGRRRLSLVRRASTASRSDRARAPANLDRLNCLNQGTPCPLSVKPGGICTEQAAIRRASGTWPAWVPWAGVDGLPAADRLDLPLDWTWPCRVASPERPSRVEQAGKATRHPRACAYRTVSTAHRKLDRVSVVRRLSAHDKSFCLVLGSSTALLAWFGWEAAERSLAGRTHRNFAEVSCGRSFLAGRAGFGGCRPTSSDAGWPRGGSVVVRSIAGVRCLSSARGSQETSASYRSDERVSASASAWIVCGAQGGSDAGASSRVRDAFRVWVAWTGDDALWRASSECR